MPANPPPDEPRDRLDTFVERWHENIIGDEKEQSQVFLDRLFQALGHGGVFEARGSPRGAHPGKEPGRTAFVNLFWKPRVLIEMKKRDEQLSTHCCR